MRTWCRKLRSGVLICLSLAGGYLQVVPSTSATATAVQPDNKKVSYAKEGWTLKKVGNVVNFS